MAPVETVSNKLTAKQRVLTALAHQQPDRTPCDYLGTPEADEKLKAHFQTENMDVVLTKLGVDLRVVSPAYVGPTLRRWDDGRFENFWGHIRKPIKNQAGVYNESVEFPYAAFSSTQDVEQFRWPTVDWFDYTSLAAQCDRYADYALVYGAPGNMDVINGTAYGMGVEKVLLGIGLDDPIVYACMEKRFECCYQISSKVLQATAGKIDIFWIGDDYGTQNGLLLSPQKWRELFFDKLKAMCDLGHTYGAKVMLSNMFRSMIFSCSVRAILVPVSFARRFLKMSAAIRNPLAGATCQLLVCFSVMSAASRSMGSCWVWRDPMSAVPSGSMMSNNYVSVTPGWPGRSAQARSFKATT